MDSGGSAAQVLGPWPGKPPEKLPGKNISTASALQHGGNPIAAKTEEPIFPNSLVKKPQDKQCCNRTDGKTLPQMCSQETAIFIKITRSFSFLVPF